MQRKTYRTIVGEFGFGLMAAALIVELFTVAAGAPLFWCLVGLFALCDLGLILYLGSAPEKETCLRDKDGLTGWEMNHPSLRLR